MKTGARFLSMLLAVLMIAGAALTVSAFPDVEAGYKYGEAINVLSQLDVIGGFEDGSFKPEENVTRAQMAKLAYVLYTTFVDAGTGSVKFDDVAANHWANGYISWCYNKEIIGGFGDGTYAPEAPVTYDQALKIVCGVLGYTEWDSKLWPTDVRQVALRQLSLGKNLEDVKGTDELTRGQVAQIMYNALKAPMKEKKIEYVEITGGYRIPVEVEMTLATDTWGFTETTYTVVGTATYDIAEAGQAAEDTIKLLEKVDGAVAADVELKDLGLEAYEDNTDALIGLDIVTIVKDEELLGAASVKGYYKDGVEVAVSADGKTLTVDGQKFTYANKDDIAIYAYGTDALTANADIFDATTKAVKAATGLNAAKPATDLLDAPYFARAFDFDGDAEIDGFMILPLVAFEVSDETEIDLDDVKDVPHIVYAQVDGTAATLGTTLGTIPAATATAALAKDDVFVGVELAGKLIVVEVIKPVEAYATSISTSAKKITIGGTTYTYVDGQVEGAQNLASLDESYLGSEATTNYWFYNGAVIKCADVDVVDEYKFGILAYVAKDESENASSIVSATSFTATLIVDGKEVKLPVSKINGAALTAATDAKYATGYAPTTYAQNDATDFDETSVTKYEYKFVTNMVEDEKGKYELTIEGVDIDGDPAEGNVYVVEAAAGAFKYNATTKLYSIGTKANSVILDDNSIIYYTYKDEEDDSEGTFEYIGNYTKATIPTVALVDNTLKTKAYLKETEDGMYILLAAFLTGELELATTDTTSYKNNGTLILYAPESQEVVVGENGKKYVSYTFLDNATLTPADAITSTVTYENVEGTVEAANLYVAKANGKGYTKIVGADLDSTFKSIKYGSISKISESLGYVFIGDNAVIVDDSVKIWGLTAADEAKQFTLAELNTMFKKLGDGQAIRVIQLLTVDADDVATTNALIVEVYEAVEGDTTGAVESVFPDLHDNFFPVLA